MKSRSFGIGVLFLSLVVPGLIFLTSCAKKDTKACRLLTPDSLSTEEIDYIKSRDLLDENEKIIYVYTMDDIKTSGTVLTINKIAVYTQESVNKEPFENIFDMKKTHSLTDSVNSQITISPKKNDDFTVEFKGGTDSDEKFFDMLKDMWRMAISSKQEKEEKQ
jgi:hypothetical protein